MSLPERSNPDDARVVAAQAALSPFGQELFDCDLSAILYHEGDLQRGGDLDDAWLCDWIEAAGVGADDGVVVIISGDLRVAGDVEVTEGCHLVVLGSVSCRTLHTGGSSWVSIAGDVHTERCVVMTYNDTMTSIDGITHAPVVVVSDHSNNATPGPDTIKIDDGYDLGAALARVVEPDLLREGHFSWRALLEHAKVGWSPFSVDLPAIRGAVQAVHDGRPGEAVDRLVALGEAGYVEFHGARQGLTPLHELAIAEANGCFGSDVDVDGLVGRLVDAGAELEATVKCYGVINKPTPLHQAVLGGATRTARALCAEGADLYRRGADGKLIDELLLGRLGALHGAEDVDVGKATRLFTAAVACLRAIEHDNADEIARVVQGHLHALEQGGPDPTNALRYRPRGWNEHAHWSEQQQRWLVQLGDVPEDARYDPSEREWIVERPGPQGYALQRRYYRPSDGTVCCVANIPDAARPNHFDMTRYHNDGSVSMIATWHDGHWEGEKIDIPYRGDGATSENFIIYTVPENMARAVSQLSNGRPTSIVFYDDEDREIDRYGQLVTSP